MIASGQTVARRITVAEGLTVAEIFALLGSTEGLDGALPPPPPEGSLLPETYFFAFGDHRAEIVKRMQRAMQEVLAELWPQRARRPAVRDARGGPHARLDRRQGDRGRGRAREGRRGVRQPAAPRHAAAGRPDGDLRPDRGRRRLGRELTRRDWEHESDYNTYRIVGLPPGPIANPGRASIEAVLNPADVDYLYFVADGSGGHAFARTLDEHNRNVADLAQDQERRHPAAAAAGTAQARSRRLSRLRFPLAIGNR